MGSPLICGPGNLAAEPRRPKHTGSIASTSRSRAALGPVRSIPPGRGRAPLDQPLFALAASSSTGPNVIPLMGSTQTKRSETRATPGTFSAATRTA
jgi:hypothetical protein